MCRKTYLLIGIVVGVGVAGQAEPGWAATLSGRVYEGSVGDESKPLSGVSVTLYGSNDSGRQGTYITSTATNSEGWYGLEAEGAFDYFNIVESDPSGYTSVGASSVGGSVVGDNWIQYDFLGLSGTTTGNRFWDQKEGGGTPTGSPPVAVDDTYSVSAGGVLNTAAPGVLGNDSDADGDPLTAIQVSGPSQGTLVLNPNGSFTYTPNSGFSGTDNFTYKANDGLLDSNVATVTVRVDTGPEPPQDSGVLDGYKRDAGTGRGLENWRIYIDLNGNSQWDPGEPSDLTDGNGYYRIADVQPGTYRVCEQMQTGWEGDHPCVDGVTIVGGVVTSQDFHNRRTGSPDGTGAIRGTKFHDLNGNGRRDPGEPGLPGWRIVLQDTDGNVLATATSDANGDYAFTDLEPESYEVDEVQQSGWRQTYPKIDGEPAVWVIGLEPEGTLDEIDFGNQRTGEPPGGQVDVFGMCLRLEMEIPGIGLVRASLSGPAQTRVQVGSGGQASDTNGNGRDDVSAELVDLALMGIDPVAGTVVMRLNADTPSTGRIEERANNTAGILDVPPYTAAGTADSSFDVWIEIELPDLGLCFRTSTSVRLAGVISHVPPSASNAYAAYLQTPADLFQGPCGGPWPDPAGPAKAFIRSLTACQGDQPGDPGQGSVTIIKRATPPDDTTFQVCANFAPGGFFDVLCWSLQDPSHPQESVSSQDLPLLRSVRETPLPGWTLKKITVTGDTDQGSTVDVSQGTVELDYDPGENIVVIFENEKTTGEDYGDAPLPYPEASHSLGGPYLGLFGDAPDADPAMQRDASAAGDDSDAGGDDENGLLSLNLVKTPGAWSTWELKGYFGPSSDAKFGFWLDLNGDGDWDDPNELRATFGFCGFGSGPQDWFHAAGAFKLPAQAKVGTTYARLRVYGDCNAAVSPSGAGGPGEVEDHVAEIRADGAGVPPGGIVHGYKWNDINSSGLWDILNPVEPPLAGWTIWLDTNNSGKQDAGDMTTQTDAQGHFRFTGVPAGTYALGERLQPGWSQTTPGGTGTYTVTVQPGQASVPQMFGNRQSGGPTTDGRIYGSKWNDLNGDAIPDAAEPPLVNWKIYLDLNQNGRWDTGEPFDLTDAAGGFEFTGLAVGSYTVAEEMQPGWQQTWPGGAGTHTISIQPGTAPPAGVMFGNAARPVPPPPDGLKKLDWGDAPDPMYPTLRASNGAYHVIVPGFHLGAAIDGEPDGQPTPDALGDDHFDADDEDGVTFLTPILPGGMADLEINASAAGLVDAWLDCDGDGTWSQPGEQILAAEPVAAGSTVLSVVVPGSAQLNLATFARFRLSRTGGLSPGGPAQDGEVEDYHVLIGPEGPGVPGEGEHPHLKWSQPPAEIAPNVDARPVFCGWNEPARSTQYSGSKRQWRMDADDFRCLGPIPITRIRWWGGYKGWNSSELPDLQPEAWHIGFWANQVPGLAPDELYLERLVWSVEIPNERVGREPVGTAEFPEAFPEMCFVYEVDLEPQEWFHQAEFPSNAGVFWVSITAVYPPDAEPRNQWGWMTRPCAWRDGAIMPAIMGEGPTSDERLFPGRITPIGRSALCGQDRPYDLCFELLTENPWVKWDQPFTGIRDWPDYADIESHGISIRQEESIGPVAADDWLCERDTPVLAAAWWGSYIGYGYEPCRCDAQQRPPRPDYFLLQMRTDRSELPGDVIWEHRAYDYDEVLVGYDRHPEGEPNEPVFRYSVRLPEDSWFHPSTADGRYWFSVTAVHTDPLPMILHPWGWTSHPHTFASGASSADYRADPRPEWQPLRDPDEQPVDMSFTLFTLARE